MFRYFSGNARLQRLTRENDELRSRLERLVSDVDYVAMLTDVELEVDGNDDVPEEENGDENEEGEEEGNE